jgi:hypothetical protein
MIKSNILKETPYPEEFTEEDKLEYDRLYAEAKIIHTEIEKETPFIIHTAIIGHIRIKNGMAQPYTNEELEEIKKQYELKSRVVECDLPPDHYAYDKENNPIYYPSTLTITSDDREEAVVVKS